MRRVLVCLVLVLFSASNVLAWGVHGHRVVASIAFRRLDVAHRDAVVAILKEHPRFQQEFDEAMPANIEGAGIATKNEWLFQQAALWPDIARDYHGNLREKFHRPNWHFINQPIFLTAADETALSGSLTVNLKLDPKTIGDKDQNVVQIIRLARKTIKSADAKKSDKALMLSWLFHTVGDLHQPAHSSAMFSKHLFPHGDRGGNMVSTAQHGSLHSLWDGFPGGKSTFFHARADGFDLIDQLEAHGKTAAMKLDEKDWLDESFALANEKVYNENVRAHLRVFEMDNDHELMPVDLSSAYLRAGGKECDKRMIAAGFRLAAVIKELVP